MSSTCREPLITKTWLFGFVILMGKSNLKVSITRLLCFFTCLNTCRYYLNLMSNTISRLSFFSLLNLHNHIFCSYPVPSIMMTSHFALASCWGWWFDPLPLFAAGQVSSPVFWRPCFLDLKQKLEKFPKGSFINDVTALRGMGHEFSDDSTKV